jgi:hypothetical protein
MNEAPFSLVARLFGHVGAQQNKQNKQNKQNEEFLPPVGAR